MNRRSFLKFLGTATVGTGIVYSFPSVIVPKNIEVESILSLLDKDMDLAMKTVTSSLNKSLYGREILPKLIEDFWFQDSPFFAYLKDKEMQSFSGGKFTKSVFNYAGGK